MILFLASLPNCVYSSLLNVFQSYSSGETKGQIICKSKQGVGSIELDCKGTQFKCLRGLGLKKVKNVLDDVANGELSLKEMAVKCHNLKQKRSIEEAFVRQLGLKDWDEAKTKYPRYTSEVVLDQFLGLSFTKSESPQVFKEFCQKVSLYSFRSDSFTSVNKFVVDSSTIAIADGDETTFTFQDLKDSSDQAATTGLSTAIIDVSECDGCTNKVSNVKFYNVPFSQHGFYFL